LKSPAVKNIVAVNGAKCDAPTGQIAAEFIRNMLLHLIQLPKNALRIENLAFDYLVRRGSSIY